MHKAVPENELAITVENIVGKLARAATKSIAVIKEQMITQLDLPYELTARHSIAVRGSYTFEDTEEGITAFFEKRAPHFSGQ